MKKGFTLIELLAVIVILAIILVIAVPQILKIIEDSKVNTYIINEKNFVRATEYYFTAGNSSYPDEIGDTVEVTYNELKDSGYVKNNDSKCNGYVLVTKIDSNDYDYTPHLICNDQVVVDSLETDKLVAHYKFDDFQEPTVNLVSNTSFEDNNTNGWTIANITNGSYLIDNTVSLYGNKSLKINVSNGGDQYQYIQHDFGTSITGRTFTVSAYIKTENINSGVRCLVYWQNSSGWTMIDLISSSIIVGTKDWTRISATAVAPINTTGVTIIIAPITTDNQGSYWIDGMQIEEKPYATPFVDGTRNGTVKDYSGNGNNAALDASETPRWVNDSKVGEGAYEFNGSNNYIPLPASLSTILNNSNFTLSAWVKSPGLASGMELNGIISLGYGLVLYIGADGNLYGAMDNGTIGVRFYTSDINLYDNKFHYVVMAYDGTNMKLYIDGIKRKEEATLWNNRYNNVSTIGSNVNDRSISKYNGIIDDIKIYKRALSDSEIEMNYKKENIQ